MALKQRRFPRNVNPNVEWLLNQGRQFGFKASGANMLDYLWQSSTGSLSEHSDLLKINSNQLMSHALLLRHPFNKHLRQCGNGAIAGQPLFIYMHHQRTTAPAAL